MKTALEIRVTRRMKLRAAARVLWDASAEHGPLVLLWVPVVLRWALR